MQHWTWLGCFWSNLSRSASRSFSVHPCQGLQLGQSLFPWWSILGERDGGWESFTEKQKADKGDNYSRLPSASCSPHRNGHFSLTWTPDCKAAHLSSPPMASCSWALAICGCEANNSLPWAHPRWEARLCEIELLPSPASKGIFMDPISTIYIFHLIF